MLNLIKPIHFDDFEQVIIKNNHFADFGQVIMKNSHFADFEQAKKNLTPKLPWEKPDTYAFFCLGYCLLLPALHPGFSDLWWSPPALSSTRHSAFFFLFLNAKASSFLILCSTCVTYGAPCHARGHQVLFIPREAEDFRRGDNHSKHVPLPTHLAWLHLYMSILEKLLLVVKTLIKNIEQQPY